MDLVNKIFETISKLTFLDKRRKINYNDIRLYPSEIHLILFIYHIQDTNITKIADQLGLTKSAISQTLSRLQKKGIIKKRTEPFKKNELQVQFTKKGQSLLEHVIEFRSSLEMKYLEFLEAKSDKEKQIISDFLDTLVLIMDHNKT
ncbi:MAG: MarR family winged helix-turn-helix transcriptional regulator [Promethearchaeota archaeon]